MLNKEEEAEREQKQLSALEASEFLLAKQIERQSLELVVLQQLERETEGARLLYESFFTRLLEMNVQLGLETADGRLLSAKQFKQVRPAQKKADFYFSVAPVG